MEIMETSIFHTLGLAKIQRARTFAGRGDVLVRVGQKVEASEPVAQFFPEEKFLILNIRKELNFKNMEDARRSINVKVGDPIQKGDIIAQPQRAMGKPFRSPYEGEIVNIIGSQVVIRLSQPPKLIFAGFDSIVTEILPFHGVVVETNGALIQGVWGNQKIASGPILTSMVDLFEEITPENINVTFRGSIVMAGHCSNAEVFKAAEELNIKGLVLASMNASIVNAAMNCKIPIIVLEGFGQIPLNERAFELLKTNENKVVSINAIYNVRNFEKPEIIIELPVEANPPVDGLELRTGSVVRVNSGAHQGKAAVIKRINQVKTKFPSSIRASSAIVQLYNQDQISIPLANLDILE